MHPGYNNKGKHTKEKHTPPYPELLLHDGRVVVCLYWVKVLHCVVITHCRHNQPRLQVDEQASGGWVGSWGWGGGGRGAVDHGIW